MLLLAFAAVISFDTMIAKTAATAEPLNCQYEFEYAPGPVELDPDGDGRWNDPETGIEQRGPIVSVTPRCSGEESTEVEP